jgi:ankyrin repeat protein
VNGRGRFGYTPLTHAAANGHLESVRVLLDRGADPNSLTTEGGSALYWAASNGHLEVVALLLKRGADVNVVRQCGWSPLTAAIYNGHEELAERLVEAGANEGHRCSGKTMYQWAVQHGRARVASVLSRHGYRMLR